MTYSIVQRSFFRNLIAVGALATATVAAATVGQAVFSAAYAETAQTSGSWDKQEYRVAGSWEIYEEDGALYLRLSDDFKTRRGPDLKLFLSPLAAASVTGSNATDGSVLIAELESPRGGQVYQLPEGTNLDDYASVIIHCEAFSKLWAAGDL